MGTRKKRKRRQQNNLLVLKLLILVAIVLVLFEGRLIYTMFTHRSEPAAVLTAESETTGTETLSSENVPQVSLDLSSGNGSADIPLAGLAATVANAGNSDSDTTVETEDIYRVSEELDSPSVVGQTDPPVDDSFFANAVFIGDSRMEGFRNSSGITQGTFLTSVGLSIDGMSNATIATAEGNISVYQGLSGRQYDKIYLMLGTNDLGYYPWEDFSGNFQNILEQFHKLQPDATIYVCSVIYVEEAKITTSYDNNENVQKVNGYMLEVCEALDYCYYINLNEIFTNGYASLIEGASSDGIHLYETYCQQMLTFLKSHYIAEAASDGESATETAQTEETADDAATEENTEDTAAE